jgi:hypothetical protein
LRISRAARLRRRASTRCNRHQQPSPALHLFQLRQCNRTTECQAACKTADRTPSTLGLSISSSCRSMSVADAAIGGRRLRPAAQAGRGALCGPCCVHLDAWWFRRPLLGFASTLLGRLVQLGFASYFSASLPFRRPLAERRLGLAGLCLLLQAPRLKMMPITCLTKPIHPRPRP